MNFTQIKIIIARQYLNIFIGFLTVIIIGLLIYASYYIFNIAINENKRLHQTQQLELAKTASTGIKYYIEGLEQDLVYASDYSSSKNDLKNYFNYQIQKKVVKSIFVFENEEVVTFLAGEKLYQSGLNELRKVVKQSLFSDDSIVCNYSDVLPIYKENNNDSLYLIMIHTVGQFRDKSEKPINTGFIISFDWLMEKFVIPLKLSQSDFAWILDDNGRLIYHPNHEEMLLRNISSSEESCLECHTSFSVQKNMLINKSSFDKYTIGSEPEKIMAYYSINLNDKTWILAISTYLPAIIGNVQNNFILFFFASGIVILLIISFAIVFFTNNLRKIRAEEAGRYLEQTRTLHENLNHASKLASIGELVDSVAHEINTPVSIISAEADALLLSRNNSQQISDELKIIKQQTKRIGQYTRSLLTYSRRIPFQPKENSLIALLDEALFLLNPRLRAKDVKVNKLFYNQIPKFVFDRGRIEQVIINLLNNAIDFIEKDPVIKIELNMIKDDEISEQKEFVIISISDNGKGISPNNIEMIFEPFFSTKPLSSGTGLGLSISKAIVLRHRGKIEVESKLNAGATFRVILPFINSKENEEKEV